MTPKESVLGIGFFNGSVEDACLEIEESSVDKAGGEPKDMAKA